MASTSEVYGDPEVHPQVESYRGNVDPTGPRSVYDEAKRFAESMTMAMHRTYGVDVGDRPHLQHLRPAALARRRAGGVQLHQPGPARRAADRLRRRIPDPESVLRRRRDRRAGRTCWTRRSPGRSTSAIPMSAPCWSWPTWSWRSQGRARRSSSSPCPPTIRRAAARTSRWPPRRSVGPPRSALRDGHHPHHGVPCPPGAGSVTIDLSEAGGEFLPRTQYSTLSVIMPVFNERSTVAEIIRRMRAVELPLTLQIIVVDDGSSDGSDKVLGALEDSTVRVITHAQNQGKGAAIRTGTGRGHRRPGADSGCRPRVRPRRLAAPARSDAQGQGPRRLRQPVHRGAQEHAAAALVRQPGPLASRPTSSTARRCRTWRRATSCSMPRRSRASPSSRTASTSSPRSRPRCCAAGSASTRCPSPTPDGSSTKGRRSRGGTASVRSWHSCASASAREF